MKSMEYMMGFMAGLLIVIVVFAVIWKVSGSESLKGDYDERQERIRGVGYKYAMYANLIMLVAYMILSMFIEDIPLYPGEVALTIIIVSVVIYALYCIRKDAFFGVRYKSRTYLILLGFVVVINLLGAVMALADGDWIEDGRYIEFGFYSNMMCVIGFGTILAAILARNASRRKEEQLDEES